MKTSKLRGHHIWFITNEWVYWDTGESVEGNDRPCGYCKKENTIEGHDGCLGTLKGIRNACCGHGQESEAYVQFSDNYCIRESEALKFMGKEYGS